MRKGKHYIPLQRSVSGDNLCDLHCKENGSVRLAFRRLWRFIIYLLNVVVSAIGFLLGLSVVAPTETEVHMSVWRDSDDLNDLLLYTCMNMNDKGEALLSPDTIPLSICDDICRTRALANMIILRKLRKETTESYTRSLRVHACTWNVDQHLPQPHMPGFGEWLLGKKLMQKVDMYKKAEGTADEVHFPVDDFPDILVVSLQEVEMGGVVLVKEYTEVGVTWSEAIVEQLNQLGSQKIFYRKLRMVQLVGIVLIVVSRSRHVKYIANVRASITRTGAMRGVWGNKGSVGLRATIYGKRFLFIAAHFAAHKSNVKERTVNYRVSFNDLCFEMPENVDDASEVLDTFNNANGPELSHVERKIAWNRLFRGFDKNVSLKKENRVLERHDYVFFLGDLNSRLHGLKSADIRRLVRHGEYDRLLCHDELRLGMISGEIFDGFQEALISFPPTYKFDRETDIYDTSRRHRDPAWCDRILFRAMLPFDPGDRVPSTHRFSPNKHTSLTGHDATGRNSYTLNDLATAHTQDPNASDMLEPALASGDHMHSLDCVLHGFEGEGRRWSLPLSSPLGSENVLESCCGSDDLESLPTFFSTRQSKCRDRRFETFPFAPNEAVAIGYQFVAQLRQSDHRPVCGQFDVRVLSFSKELIDDIMQDVRKEIAELQRSFFLSSWTLPPTVTSTTFSDNSNEDEKELII